MQTRGSLINEQVDLKLEALRHLPIGPAAGRPLNFCEAGVNPVGDVADSNNFLRILFTDIGDVVGSDFISNLDPVLLEQFCMMSVLRNEPGGTMLKALIESYMVAYAQQATACQAVQCLDSLVGLVPTDAPTPLSS